MNGRDTVSVPPKAPSLWEELAPAAPEYPSLAVSDRAEVLVVGGGYAGLHAALTLARAGKTVIVAEAGPLGTGGSGRNGGVVNAKFRISYSALAQSHGIATARRMHEIAGRSVAYLEETLERYDIGAHYARHGALRCAHTARAFEALARDAEWQKAELGVSGLALLDRQEMQRETGSTDFCGGVLAPQGGTIRPLDYLHGLAQAAVRAGVRLYARSPVLEVEEATGSLRATLPNGEIRADHVLYATDAYSSISRVTAPLRRSVVPFRSAMVATAPLPATMSEEICANARSYTETRRMMRWFRREGDRLIFGGRGALGAVDAPAAFARLESAMRAIFPQLEGHPVTHRWSGHVALTFDALPMAGALTQRQHFAAGFNGAGVAMSGYVGHCMARRFLGEAPDLGLVARDTLPKVPFFAFRSIGVRAVTAGYETLDRLGF
ncbi:NAD(P)/FAD-dependent oxidoreductase [Thioclava kandeliae]|uniref:FAD-binding oxidoreductase n=1 Tax=Thioclava kandeliae TaxID=3070818 RepID=A0ABV1SDW5_9RHOB